VSPTPQIRKKLFASPLIRENNKTPRPVRKNKLFENVDPRLLDHMSRTRDVSPEEKSTVLKSMLSRENNKSLLNLSKDHGQFNSEKDKWVLFVSNLKQKLEESKEAIELLNRGNTRAGKEYLRMKDEKVVSFMYLILDFQPSVRT